MRWFAWVMQWVVYSLPLLLVLIFWGVFLPYVKKASRHMTRTNEHMDRVEALLERVALAVEAKEKDS